MTSAARAGWSVVAVAVLGLAWTVLEVLPPVLGYEDTDDPSVMVQFLRDHGTLYRIDGIVLVLLSGALVIAVLSVADHLDRIQRPGIARRVAGVFGLMATAMLLPLAGLRLAATSTLLHVDGLSTDWSEAAYLSVQMVGTQALGAGAVIALCVWAIGLCLDAWSTRVLPRWLVYLGVIPAFRVVITVAGPLVPIDGWISSVLWITAMVAIPGTMVWILMLGVTLIRDGRRFARQAAVEGDTTPT